MHLRSLLATASATALVVLCVACSDAADPGSNPTTAPDDRNEATDQIDGKCPLPSKVLNGQRDRGEDCSQEGAVTCIPVCCTCDSSSNAWQAVLCQDGKCASAADTCRATADERRFCAR